MRAKIYGETCTYELFAKKVALVFSLLFQQSRSKYLDVLVSIERELSKLYVLIRFARGKEFSSPGFRDNFEQKNRKNDHV